MRIRKSIFSYLVVFLITGQLYSQVSVTRIDPPFWWVGMEEPSLQLMIYGKQLAEANVIVDYPGVVLKKTGSPGNDNYMVLDLEISKEARPGTMKIIIEYQREILHVIDYSLLKRQDGSKNRAGFGKSDVIYLIMPDRFSNGDRGNDTVPGLLEQTDRNNPDGRHGGDLAGISQKVGYLADLGVTALWLNPVQINDMPSKSYHGYAITDFYQVDPRFGDNEQYKALVEECHKEGIKVIMDMVFNHCGGNHFWINDLPSPDWVHQFPEFTRSNFRIETAIDPYASAYDRNLMQTGWFDTPMPDLNQHNPYLANYLIQNSIWWVEYTGLDGIRMDTYPYSYADFMASWMDRIMKEYPDFSIIGETWLQKEAHTAYWQKGTPINSTGEARLVNVTDFPMHYALRDAFTEGEGWSSGLARIYYVLSQDNLYNDPFNNIIFADNHDLTRFYTSIGEDWNKYKMAMAVLLTTRGIPLIYYGTELLMTGEEHKGHGFIRQDFPLGEWEVAVAGRRSPVDSQQSAVGSQQLEAMEFLQKLLSWRKGSEAVLSGKLMQFVPKDGIYVFARYTETETVLVIINKNKENKNLDLERFREVIKDSPKGRDVISGNELILDKVLEVPAETALILELE